VEKVKVKINASKKFPSIKQLFWGQEKPEAEISNLLGFLV
jgi:hypothetical protein